MNSIEFEVKTRVICGEGEAKRLHEYLKDNKYKSIGIVVDKNVEETSYWKEVYKSLSDLPVTTKFIYDFGEPTYQQLNEHRIKFKNNDIIIGVGGGSVIDFAKGLSFLAKNKNTAISYRGFPLNIRHPVPTIAIPTTAGTGSEVTYNAVFVDENTKQKLGINTKLNFPKLAILDPKFLEHCPESVIISSALDALTHAFESYVCTKANRITKPLSEQAINLLTWHLQSFNNFPNTLEELQIAAYLAGLALMNSGSGPAGAMSYILGPKFNVPHGLAGGVFLQHIIKHNEKNKVGIYDELEFLSPLSEIVENICDIWNVDCTSLRQFGVNKTNVDILLKGVETLQPAFNQNSVKFTINDAKNIIKGMI